MTVASRAGRPGRHRRAQRLSRRSATSCGTSRSWSGRSRTRSRSCSSRARWGFRLRSRTSSRPRCSSAAVIWAFLGIIFEIVTETVAWERWEGTIEYTFMAPLSRPDAPLRHGRVRGHLRAAPGDDPVLRRGRRSSASTCPIANFAACARTARDRVRVVHRDRDDDVGAAADLAGEGRAARLRRAGADARRLGRLLPRVRDAGAGCRRSRRSRPRRTRIRGCRASIIDGARLLWANVWPLLVIGWCPSRSGCGSSGAASGTRRRPGS